MRGAAGGVGDLRARSRSRDKPGVASRLPAGVLSVDNFLGVASLTFVYHSSSSSPLLMAPNLILDFTVERRRSTAPPRKPQWSTTRPYLDFHSPLH